MKNGLFRILNYSDEEERGTRRKVGRGGKWDEEEGGGKDEEEEATRRVKNEKV